MLTGEVFLVVFEIAVSLEHRLPGGIAGAESDHGAGGLTGGGLVQIAGQGAFEAGDAAEAPVVQGDAVGQLVFEDADGFEFLDDAGVEGFPDGGVFAGEDGTLGAEAMRGGVGGGAFFAGVGARAGRLGGHGVPHGVGWRAMFTGQITGGLYVGWRAESGVHHRPCSGGFC